MFIKIQCSGKYMQYAELEFATAVVNVAIFWGIAPYSPHVNQSSGGTYRSHMLHSGFLRD
jgi:hypothetical protein